jgi:hypothetical protein
LTDTAQTKGNAVYLDIVSGDKVAPGAAWSYPDPAPEYAAIRGHIALYASAMDSCTVDGVAVVPQPGSFYGGWITPRVVGPFKGSRGTAGW